MNSYARAGVDRVNADTGVSALVSVLRTIDPGRPSRSVVPSGHYASVLELAPNLGLALTTDGVGSKVIVAEQMGQFETIGIDCVAMNVNDLVCVGAEPIALLDYIAVERADSEMLCAIGEGLKVGAETAGVEIPGGELAQLPELLRGHPSPYGFDLVGTCFGTVALDQLILGSECTPGDAVIGVPATGVHSNGLTLARKALLDGGLTLEERPAELAGESVGEALLTPTAIYVRAVLALLRSEITVTGLAHITGGGLRNLLRLSEKVGWQIDSPLEPQPIFDLIAGCGQIDVAEMYEVFNMGCGLVVVTAIDQAQAASELLTEFHPGARVIGRVTDKAATVVIEGRGDSQPAEQLMFTPPKCSS